MSGKPTNQASGITSGLPIIQCQSDMKVESNQHFASSKACDAQCPAVEVLEHPFFFSAILSKADSVLHQSEAAARSNPGRRTLTGAAASASPRCQCQNSGRMGRPHHLRIRPGDPAIAGYKTKPRVHGVTCTRDLVQHPGVWELEINFATELKDSRVER
jgi:hypothetical protein